MSRLQTFQTFQTAATNAITAKKWDLHVKIVMTREVGVKDKFFDQVGWRVKEYILEDI